MLLEFIVFHWMFHPVFQIPQEKGREEMEKQQKEQTQCAKATRSKKEEMEMEQKKLERRDHHSQGETTHVPT